MGKGIHSNFCQKAIIRFDYYIPINFHFLDIDIQFYSVIRFCPVNITYNRYKISNSSFRSLILLMKRIILEFFFRRKSIVCGFFVEFCFGLLCTECHGHKFKMLTSHL